MKHAPQKIRPISTEEQKTAEEVVQPSSKLLSAGGWPLPPAGAFAPVLLRLPLSSKLLTPLLVKSAASGASESAVNPIKRGGPVGRKAPDSREPLSPCQNPHGRQTTPEGGPLH